LPVLRKDFTVSLRDVYDARAMGADAVLLIAAVLDDAELAALSVAARACDMSVLVEVHDEKEVLRALDQGASMIGVNQRDLHTFEVDSARAVALATSIPSSVLKVAESGIAGAKDVALLAAAGYDAVLVGEALVSSTDPAAAVASLSAAASKAAFPCG
ncbi:MAG: indole-3-glycerol phosphate synthase TrpC, partial [Acidimicrobiales bacterium]